MEFPNSSNKRKILLLTANPKDFSPLRLDEELRRITDALERCKKRDEFDVYTKTAISIQHLRRAILDFEPEIIHFCGHGAGKDGIVVEDQIGQTRLIPTNALADLFELTGGNLKCVVLNACYAEFQAEEIVKHIEYVVGMKYAIGDEAAIKFSEGFYDALGAGRDFPICFKFGKNSIALENIPEDLVPVLKIKSRETKYKANSNPNKSLNNPNESLKPLLEDHSANHSDDLGVSKESPISSEDPKNLPSENGGFYKKKVAGYACLSIIPLIILFLMWTGIVGRSEFAGYYTEQKPEEYTRGNFFMHADGASLTIYFDYTINKYRASESCTWEMYYVGNGSKIKVGGYTAEWVYTENPSSYGDALIMDGKSFRRLGTGVDDVALKDLPPSVKKEYDDLMSSFRGEFKTANCEIRLNEAKHIIRKNIYNGESNPDEGTFVRQN